MALARANTRLSTLTINGAAVTARPRETVLQAALRGGVDFPNSCRVGGCGACKCRLARGEVRELTETGYLLSAEELERGYILACQSVPRTDLELELERAPAHGVAGRVIGQERVTHDITRLTVQLEAPLPYRAGQFANLSIDGLPGVVRSYSMATPAREDGRLQFFIRRVPGGKFSGLVNDEDVLGREVRVDGPAGEFWLRPSDAPMVLIAGGSGLAPILALLRAAADAGARRSVTLLFGARSQRDLYAQEEIAAIARDWRGEFRFVPVLSEEPEGASWSGARGLVTERIEDVLEDGSHAYLCGPPRMIDAATALLRARGIAADDIHFDAFTTAADAAAAEAKRAEAEAAEAELAGPLHYLKYFAFHGIGLFSAAALLAGGAYTTAGLLGVLAVYILGDALLGDDTSLPAFKRPELLTAQLWLALPLLALIVFTAVWSVCAGDPLGFGAWVTGWSGYDALAAREATSLGQHVAGWVITGLMIGMVGTIPAHELTHRTWDPRSLLIGRWLLAFSFDTAFAVEHVYGHHRYVSTEEDPATAPRGRNVYYHVVASTIAGNISAWRIEAARLRKRGQATLSRGNMVLRGYLMSALLVAAAFAMGGWVAAGFFTACALFGKALLEIVNYMEHYGMVRNPETPVQPRHSWNTNRRVSSWAMFNLTRHSHHHAQGEVPFHELESYPDAPMMINGYLTTLIVALVPPLWHHLMTPKVLEWDREFATPEERALAARANARSGLAAFAASSQAPAVAPARLSAARG